MKLTRSGKGSSTEPLSKKDGKPSPSSPPRKKTERELGNWIAAYAEYTKESESPDNYHFWTSLSIIASAVRRNIVLDQGIYELFPHMFVILVGPPGRVAKSTTIRLGRKILTGIEDMNMGPDSVTREELIRQLAKVGRGQKQAAMTIHSTELSSLIEPSGITMIQFLTDIYDGDVRWGYATKTSGRDTIDNPVLNILAGTTPSWISEGLPSDVLGHGFIARVIFVFAEKPRYLRPFPKGADQELVTSLTNDLDHISRLEGNFTWGEGSKRSYEAMYKTLAGSIPKDYRLEGFHNRKKIHVLKVAMLLSIAESDNLILNVRDLETAWDLLTNIEIDMGKAFSAVGKHEQASNIERMLARIRNDGGMTPQAIHDQFFAMGDIQDIARNLLMLESMGKIKKTKNQDGVGFVYLPVM